MKRSRDQDDRSPQTSVSRKERQMANKYCRDLVAQGQVLNNQRQRVLSLQDITLNFVVEIVEQCAHNKQDPRPLDEYPSPLLDLVFDKLSECDEDRNNMMIHFDIVKQTITQRSRQVAFTLQDDGDSDYEPPWSPWSHENVQSVLAMLDKCKNQLTTLDIHVDSGLTEAARPSLPQIHELVRHQANLTELRLACDINDQTLAIISSTCPNLRHLDIEGNDAVTDAGLQYLIRGPEGKLSNITNLDVNDTSVTGSGIAKFMFELRAQLECVVAEENAMSTALVELCQISPPVQFPKYNSLLNDVDTNPYFAKMVSMMPNVTSLESSPCLDVTPLLSLTQVKELDLNLKHDAKKNCNFITEKLIPQWRSNLTCVFLSNNLNSDVDLDFSVFTQCPNLVELVLIGFNLKVETNHELLPSSFSKLGLCDIDRQIPDEIVTKILTSPFLEKFAVDFVIPDHVITSVISEIHVNPQILSELKRLQFRCTCEFTLDTWIQLLCVLPDNTELGIGDRGDTISYELLGKLKSFAERNNIFVNFF